MDAMFSNMVSERYHPPWMVSLLHFLSFLLSYFIFISSYLFPKNNHFTLGSFFFSISLDLWFLDFRLTSNKFVLENSYSSPPPIPRLCRCITATSFMTTRCSSSTRFVVSSVFIYGFLSPSIRYLCFADWVLRFCELWSDLLFLNSVFLFILFFDFCCNCDPDLVSSFFTSGDSIWVLLLWNLVSFLHGGSCCFGPWRWWFWSVNCWEWNFED